VESDGQCSIFDAFFILRDGEWHGDKEIRARMGNHPGATGQVRMLRTPKNGKFKVPMRTGKSLGFDKSLGKCFYRMDLNWTRTQRLVAHCFEHRELPTFLLERMTEDDAAMEARINEEMECETISGHDEHEVILTTDELVYLLGTLRGEMQLAHPRIRNQWGNIRDRVTLKLVDMLPDGVRRPGDLVDLDGSEDDEGEDVE
jgi:hypothetical protein